MVSTCCPANSSTASRRRSICPLSVSGCSIQERKSRPPMAVEVLSSSQSREPFRARLRMDSVSSRLRRVLRSSSMVEEP